MTTFGSRPLVIASLIGLAGAAQASAAGVTIPDPCKAVAVADIEATLGAPGEGRARGEGSRRICTYAGGTVVGISEANQFEPSVSTVKTHSKCEDVSGVGDRAVF